MSESVLPLKRKLAKPRKQPQYGEIPGFPVGSRWEDREHMYQDGFHVTLQAGIQGREQTGACSIVLSGGYEDDVDLGEEFTYTGAGGQRPRNDKDRSQQKDQEWKRGNRALQMSHLLQKPVRVIRGSRLEKSNFAPAEGYRYDGLYDVVESDMKPGKSGHLVCLFRFKRCPGQLPLPGPEATLPMRRKRSRISPSPSTTTQPARSRTPRDIARPMFVQGSSSNPSIPALTGAHLQLTGSNDSGGVETSSNEDFPPKRRRISSPIGLAPESEHLISSASPIKAEEVDEFEGQEGEDSRLKAEIDYIYMEQSLEDVFSLSGGYEVEDGEVDMEEHKAVHETELEEGEIY